MFCGRVCEWNFNGVLFAVGMKLLVKVMLHEMEILKITPDVTFPTHWCVLGTVSVVEPRVLLQNPLFSSYVQCHYFISSPPLLHALSCGDLKELQNMAASYHHTKEALSLPECCLHPSHLHSQLGSLMSEYNKWIEGVRTVDFTVTSDTDM